jgi:hypothetical protein
MVPQQDRISVGYCASRENGEKHVIFNEARVCGGQCAGIREYYYRMLTGAVGLRRGFHGQQEQPPDKRGESRARVWFGPFSVMLMATKRTR